MKVMVFAVILQVMCELLDLKSCSSDGAIYLWSIDWLFWPVAAVSMLRQSSGTAGAD